MSVKDLANNLIHKRCEELLPDSAADGNCAFSSWEHAMGTTIIGAKCLYLKICEIFTHTEKILINQGT